MSQRITFEPAFVLHRYPYRNTSFIVELFTLHHGRISVVARSARGPQSRYKGILQLFSPLLVSWVGRGELKTLGDVELEAAPYDLNANALLCGFYMNELLQRLLHREDAYSELFSIYQKTLQNLMWVAHSNDLQKVLRCFEKQLLQELGYGTSLNREAHSGEMIHSHLHYRYIPERGFLRCEDYSPNLPPQAMIFSGHSLIALQHEQFEDENILPEIKRLMRMLLLPYLGNKPLKSRELLL